MDPSTIEWILTCVSETIFDSLRFLAYCHTDAYIATCLGERRQLFIPERMPSCPLNTRNAAPRGGTSLSEQVINSDPLVPPLCSISCRNCPLTCQIHVAKLPRPFRCLVSNPVVQISYRSRNVSLGRTPGQVSDVENFELRQSCELFEILVSKFLSASITRVHTCFKHFKCFFFGPNRALSSSRRFAQGERILDR